MIPRLLLFILCSVLSFPGASHAQRVMTPLAGEPPTAGLHLFAPSLVGSHDASGVELNPANLGLLERWSFVFHHTWIKEGGRINGAGDGFFFASPVPYLKVLSLGLGLQFLRPPPAVGYVDSGKISFAVALRPSPMLSIGLGQHLFIADDNADQDNLSTTDLGLVVRPLEWLAGALTVRDLTTPLFDGIPLQRTYDLELALRPLATRQWEIGLGLRLGERRGELDPHFRLEGEPLPGFRIGGYLEVLNRDFFRNGTSQTDVRATFGLGFNLERIGVSMATIAGRELTAGPGPLESAAARAGWQGLEWTLRLYGQRQPPLVAGRTLLVNIELSNSLEQRQLIQLVRLFGTITERQDVAGVLIELDGLGTGWAQAQELRSMIKRLRGQGKKVYVYLRHASDKEYYIATAADRVLLDPVGGLQLQGMVLRSLYLRGTFDLLGVSPQFVRIAEFKSAPETYTRRSASPPARQMMEAQLKDLFDQLTKDLGHDRQKTAAEILRLIDQGPFTPPAALAAGLVDELVEVTELSSHLEEVSQARLVEPEELERAASRWPVGPSVAILLIDGDIVRGKSSDIPLIDRHVVGDNTIAQALSMIRRKKSIKAVVLRVNSPGGSAMASDRIWQEVIRTRQVKPVIVSMGDIAASGGYYVACAGTTVLAQRATITGSIGIFSGKFDLSGLLAKLGISIGSIARGKRALMESFDRPYTKEERAIVLKHLQHLYRRFLKVVAQSRRLTQDHVHQQGKGRIWTGRQAMTHQLVDREGGLWDALEEAKRRSGLSLKRPVQLLILPQPEKSMLSRVLGLLGAKTQPSPPLLPQVVTRALRGVLPVLFHATPGEPLARMPFEVE